jgi:hypothetical protein
VHVEAGKGAVGGGERRLGEAEVEDDAIALELAIRGGQQLDEERRELGGRVTWIA